MRRRRRPPAPRKNNIGRRNRLPYLFFAGFEVEAEGADPDGAAVAVVGGVGDVLQVQGGEEPWAEFRGVVGFRDGFRGVAKGAVSDQEVVPAAFEVFAMDRG